MKDQLAARGTSEFLKYLRSLDIQLTAKDGRLACDAPTGVLTAELQRQIRERKADILELLQRNPNLKPLSLGQQRLWYLSQLDPASTVYNLSLPLRLSGAVNRVALDRTLSEIVRRHEPLRTVFRNIDGAPMACAMPGLDWELAYADLRSGVQDLKDIIDSALRCPFDLEKDWPFRATLIQTGDSESVLLLAWHQIAGDGKSFTILLRELASLYESFDAARTSDLPELTTDYSQFVTHQMNRLANAGETQMAYWRRQLQGAVAAELPSDRPRPAAPTFRGRRTTYEVSAETAAAAQKLAQSEQVSLHAALMAVFYVLLNRYTGQTDITIGSTVAGRNRPEFENLIGCFINTLPLRTSLEGNPCVRELLRRVRETTMDGIAHQRVPFEWMVAEFLQVRDLNRAPFFEVMFNLEDQLIEPFELSGLMAEPLEVDPGVARLDLTLEGVETENGLLLHLEYSTDLFDEGTIQRLARHFEQLLAELAADPARPISELRMLSDTEVSALLATGEGSRLKYRHEMTVSEWIEEQSSMSPKAVAVICEGRELTYAELSRRSNRLARHLRSLGVASGSLVGVCLERSEEMIVAVLGVLKSGAAYVPLDPQFPAERLAFMAEDAAISLLLTERSLRGVVPQGDGVPLLEIDTDSRSIQSQHDEPLPDYPSSLDLAYVIYTSGSTGKPKGVQIPHRALANFLHSMRLEPGMAAEDCLLSVTTLSFDIAGLEMYLPLVTGARVVVATREVVSDGPLLAELIATCRATVLQATPATWRLLLESGWSGTPGLKMICGGEALPQDLAARLLATGGELWNAYGPTETTIWSTLQRVTDSNFANSIGRPIGNTQIVLLSDSGGLVPRGAIGELYIGGDGLALGYLNRDELTREKFVDHPFDSGKRLYRTGDLARWLLNGTLHFLGRMDHQVKIRGYRVELGEIEVVLESMPQIRQAVVVLREIGPGDHRLVAYLVLRDGSEIDSVAVREHLGAALPDYMVPAHLEVLPSIPLTPNGKVDKRALPAPQVASQSRDLPRTAMERRVAEIWQDVLRTDAVGIHDNFFDIGGHSLLLVQMQNRLRSSLGSELSIQDLFRHSTVAAIAEHLNTKGAKVPQ